MGSLRLVPDLPEKKHDREEKEGGREDGQASDAESKQNPSESRALLPGQPCNRLSGPVMEKSEIYLYC